MPANEYVYIDVFLNTNRHQIIKGLFQYDHGIKFKLHGQASSEAWQMQYGCAGITETVTEFSELEDGTVVVGVPDVLLMQPTDVVCYIYVGDEESGITSYELIIPIIQRIRPAAVAYTEEQINSFYALLNKLNALINIVNDTNSESEDINEQLKSELDRLEITNFYVNPLDGNLYAGS